MTLSMNQKWGGIRIVLLTRPRFPLLSDPFHKDSGKDVKDLGEEGEMSLPLNANNRPVCL